MDGLTILGTAIGSAKLIEKLLGPTAEYLGEGVKAWTARRFENTKRIFQIAVKRLGSDIDKKGTVPPKVLKSVLSDGSFCDDQLAAEYFGGVLASSRSGVSRDDRGAFFMTLLARMTSYHIRTHYIFYKSIKNLYDGTRISPSTKLSRQQLRIYIPMDSFVQAMEFSDKEDPNNLLAIAMFSLSSEALIDDEWVSGDIHKQPNSGLDKPGIVFGPSVLGTELFLWAFGLRQVGYDNFLHSNVQLPDDLGITLPIGTRKVPSKGHDVTLEFSHSTPSPKDSTK
jgi:hypothetical protein